MHSMISSIQIQPKIKIEGDYIAEEVQNHVTPEQKESF